MTAAQLPKRPSQLQIMGFYRDLLNALPVYARRVLPSVQTFENHPKWRAAIAYAMDKYMKSVFKAKNP